MEKPKNKPNKEQRKTMIAMAIELGVKAVMRSHLYQFNGEIYLQSEGGPIGLELAGAVARVGYSCCGGTGNYWKKLENWWKGQSWIGECTST